MAISVRLGLGYLRHGASDLELGEEDLSLLSAQALSSPTSLVYNNNSNVSMHPKHQEAEGDGEGAEQGRQVAL